MVRFWEALGTRMEPSPVERGRSTPDREKCAATYSPSAQESITPRAKNPGAKPRCGASRTLCGGGGEDQREGAVGQCVGHAEECGPLGLVGGGRRDAVHADDCPAHWLA